MEKKFSAERIQYPEESGRERYGEKNAATCTALNEGAKFAVVFTSPIYEGELRITGDGDLYYAVVVLADWGKLRYPLLEEAADTFFMLQECRAANNEGGQDLDVPLSEFEEWMRQEFAGFAGCIEAKSGDVSDRRDAIAAGSRKARGQEEEKVPAKPTGRTSKRRLRFREGEIMLRWSESRGGYEIGTLSVPGSTFAFGEGVKDVLAEASAVDWQSDHRLVYLQTMFAIVLEAVKTIRIEAISKFYRDNKERLDLE